MILDDFSKVIRRVLDKNIKKQTKQFASNKKIKWYSDMAAIIISKGWHYFESIISSKDYCSK
jgi:hypothetical protein